MNHIIVDSSMLASIGYDPATLTMEALFKREGLYSHPDISPDHFERVLHPGPEHDHSVGKAYNALIRPLRSGRKIGTKLGEPLDGVTAEGAPEPAPRIREALTASLDAAPAAAPLPAEVQAVESKSSSLAVQALEIKVTDPDTQVLAADMLITVAQMQTEIEQTFAPMKSAAYTAHRVICQQETNLKAPLVAAEAALKRQIAEFVTEQNRLAAAADEEARRQAQIAANREAEAASVDQALEQAVKLEARGDIKAAEAVLANPAPVSPRYMAPARTQPNVARTPGISTKEGWDFRITDYHAIPREYMLINETAIRAAGKNTQGRAKIAGIEFFPKTVVATSRRG
jgi:hypothetical protein